MAFFPASPMPKSLQRETSSEVDDSPSIYNARDYNIHHREILAIERLLVGDGVGETDGGMAGAIAQALLSLKSISDNGIFTQLSGTVLNNEFISIPPTFANTRTSGGTLSPSATTINVVSTVGFPDSGLLTKFNNTNSLFAGGNKTYGFGKSIINSEVIRYSGRTATSFTGCVRAVEGVAQALADPYAVIVAGRASLMLTHDYWQTTAQPVQFIAEHDARLNVKTSLLNVSTTDLTIQIGYALTIAGSFADVIFSENLA